MASSSSRYSTSSVCSISSGCVRPRLHARFGDDTTISSITEPGEELDDHCTAHRGDRESFGGYHGDQNYIQGGSQVDWSLGDDIQTADVGGVRAMGQNYFLSADVRGFEPHEVVVLAYNQCVVIHAEKIGADGRVAGRFTHKSVLPADMDPLSVSSSLTADGTLIISIARVQSKSTARFTSDLRNTPDQVGMWQRNEWHI